MDLFLGQESILGRMNVFGLGRWATSPFLCALLVFRATGPTIAPQNLTFCRLRKKGDFDVTSLTPALGSSKFQTAFSPAQDTSLTFRRQEHAIIK